jgi:hypothetical protein
VVRVSAHAQKVDPQRVAIPSPSKPKLVIRAEELFPLTPPTRIGMFTLVRPEANGEVVRMAIPDGELVSRAARAISDANHRRAERKANDRVRKDLAQFLASSKAKDANAP